LDATNPFVYDNPLIDTFLNSFKTSEKDSRVVYKFTASEDFTGSHATIVQKVKEIETESSQLLSGLTTDMNEYEKYRYIAEALCQVDAGVKNIPKCNATEYAFMNGKTNDL